MRIKRILAALLALVLCLSFAACGKKEEPASETLKIEGAAIQYELEFGGVYIEMTIDDFNKLGFV